MTVDELRKLVRLDEASGHVFFISGQRKGMRAVAGVGSRGYLKGMIGREWLMASRVVWALHTGNWPTHQIDHINHDKTDNRPCNLRDATNSQNCQNRRSRAGSSSRFVGVCWNKDSRLWQAGIKVGGKTQHLGLFEDEADAALAFNFAAAEAYGEFAAMNREAA